MTPTLSISYLPPIPYIATCIRSKSVVLEKHEHFVKQTYRNRALIYSANGILPLIIPVQHTGLFTVPISEVLISYDTDWQKIHWRSIVSSYRNSPFFEYFEEDFAALYQRKTPTLFEFNLGLLMLILRFTGAEPAVTFTTAYQKTTEGTTDLRNHFTSSHFGQSGIKTSENRYRQVFSDRHGFIAGLSILDLLFNEGTKCRESLLEIHQ